jgi:anti-anti-sigma factor
MNVVSEVVGGLLVVHIHGRVDQTTSEAFGVALKPALDGCKKDAPPVILDFAGVEYISSVGLRVLMMAARQIKAQQGKLAIAGLNPVVAEVFTITRFNLVLPCHGTIDDAGKALLS